MKKIVLEEMYMDGEVLHCMPYAEDQREQAKNAWQVICKKKPEAKKIVRGLNRAGKYVEYGDTNYPWDEETSIVVYVDYGVGSKPRLFLSKKYRSGFITVSTRSGKLMDVSIVKCVRRTMASIMDEMLAKPNFDRLWYIEEIMTETQRKTSRIDKLCAPKKQKYEPFTLDKRCDDCPDDSIICEACRRFGGRE